MSGEKGEWGESHEDGKARGVSQLLGHHGGQYLFVVPDVELIAVFTGWNIAETVWPSWAETLQPVLEAVVDGKR